MTLITPSPLELGRKNERTRRNSHATPTRIWRGDCFRQWDFVGGRLLMDITQLLTFAHQQGASDVHLSSDEPPMLRLHGDMKRLEHPPLNAEEVHHMCFDIMSDVLRKTFDETHDVDFSFELGDIARFRVNVFRQRKGEAACFRLIPSKVMTMEQLGLPSVLREICDKEKGLVLVTGPTG
ncbi:MAG TPA: hypothetical protein VMJ74_11495, partial [Pseudomonadales bacterium]|nr:hypothetical protein [Pseudomonadales bacterium]